MNELILNRRSGGLFAGSEQSLRTPNEAGPAPAPPRAGPGRGGTATPRRKGEARPSR